jgi:hypothetical protein
VNHVVSGYIDSAGRTPLTSRPLSKAFGPSQNSFSTSKSAPLWSFPKPIYSLRPWESNKLRKLEGLRSIRWDISLEHNYGRYHLNSHGN